MDNFEYSLDYEWYDTFFEDFIYELDKYGIEVSYKDIEFNLFSQGSHLSPVKIHPDLEKFIEKTNIEIRFGLVEVLSEYFSFDISSYGRVQYEGYGMPGGCDRIYDYLVDRAEEIAEAMTAIIKDVAYDIKQSMEHYILYTMSDEFKDEFLSSDDTEYFSDGSVCDIMITTIEDDSYWTGETGVSIIKKMALPMLKQYKKDVSKIIEMDSEYWSIEYEGRTIHFGEALDIVITEFERILEDDFEVEKSYKVLELFTKMIPSLWY
jgi:hypothetical protein